jgi:sulfate transport system permease protein
MVVCSTTSIHPASEPAFLTGFWQRAGLQRSALPRFGPALGITLVWLSLFVLLPLAALLAAPMAMGWKAMLHVLTEPRTLAAFRLSFGSAALAAMIDLPLGLLLAWVLVRVRLPGWQILDGLIDLPFALPTAVAGITLTALYSVNGWLGAPLARLGVQVAYTPAGILLAMVFVGLPFVVRTAQPVLRDLPADIEESAQTLGATRWQIGLRVILPSLLPALITGFGLAFARGVGEYGSVIFIAGNMPMISEIVPLLVVIKLQQFDYAGASCIGLAMLLCAAICLALIAAIERRVAALQPAQ